MVQTCEESVRLIGSVSLIVLFSKNKFISDIFLCHFEA